MAPPGQHWTIHSAQNHPTYANGISDGHLVGYYQDSSGNLHGFLAVPTIPQLAISLSGKPLTVSRRYPSVGWTLEQNPDLSSTNWPPGGGIFNDGTNNLLTVSPQTGNLFFRLRQ